MDLCPSHLALFYQTQHKAWPLLLSMMLEHYLSWLELTRFRLSCPFLFGSFTSATPIESFVRLLYSLQNNWYDVFVLARSWKEAAENIQLTFAASTQTALRAIYIIVDSLVSWLGHRKLKLHDFRRIIHNVLNIPTYHHLQVNTGLTLPIPRPYKERWNKRELRSLEDLSLLTQHVCGPHVPFFIEFCVSLSVSIVYWVRCFAAISVLIRRFRLPSVSILPASSPLNRLWPPMTAHGDPPLDTSNNTTHRLGVTTINAGPSSSTTPANSDQLTHDSHYEKQALRRALQQRPKKHGRDPNPDIGVLQPIPSTECKGLPPATGVTFTSGNTIRRGHGEQLDHASETLVCYRTL